MMRNTLVYSESAGVFEWLYARTHTHTNAERYERGYTLTHTKTHSKTLMLGGMNTNALMHTLLGQCTHGKRIISPEDLPDKKSYTLNRNSFKFH